MTLLRDMHITFTGSKHTHAATCIGTQSNKLAHKCIHSKKEKTKKKKIHKWPHPIKGGQSSIRGHISSWSCWVHYVKNCLGWLAQSRKSAQGIKNPFHITHHLLLLAALIFTGQSCRELIGMSNFRDGNSTITDFFFFTQLFSLHVSSVGYCHHCCMFEKKRFPPFLDRKVIRMVLKQGISPSVCSLITIHSMGFTLGRCIAEDRRKWSVECKVVWMNNFKGSVHPKIKTLFFFLHFSYSKI